MNPETAICRAQVYRFLSDAFLYPDENWLDDLPSLQTILFQLGMETLLQTCNLEASEQHFTLEGLQAEHRRVFGLSGSLCYETEYGLPHEYRQSQELADISGFYRAFGFNVGGEVRERPDYIATELEFMYVLALKEAWALVQGRDEWLEVTLQAQRRFLEGHLGRWLALFAASVLHLSGESEKVQTFSPYVALAQLAATFVQSEAERIGAQVQSLPLSGVAHTPLGAEISCGDCAIGLKSA
ncbi:MAG: molecular chaperone [Anaerolineales bacterium]